jgi:glycosyltransferase involved in cell wall biosynthesis
MRIAIWHNLPSGGGKRALYNHVRGLVARGHTIEAWCPPTADQTYLSLGDLISEHIVPLTLPTRSDWDRRLRIPAKIDPLLAAMDDHSRACADQISGGGFDILFAHACMFVRTTAIARFLKLPKVLYLQEPFRSLFEALPRLPWLAPPPSELRLLSLGRLREEALDRRTLHNARIQAREEVRNAAGFDRILVNSFFSRESILRAYGLDAEVSYLGTDLARFADQGRQRENFVIGLGSFTPEKNLHLVIEALALLPAPRPELAWVGNAVHQNTLDEMMFLAASRGVSFTPHVKIPDDELVGLLNGTSD